MAQFATWQAVIGVFVCLNIIQFVVGSYIEPRVSGAVLAMSPSVVLFAVFFWTFLWGLFGAFIGVPIAIAILTFCSMTRRADGSPIFSAARWEGESADEPLGVRFGGGDVDALRRVSAQARPSGPGPACGCRNGSGLRRPRP